LTQRHYVVVPSTYCIIQYVPVSTTFIVLLFTKNSFGHLFGTGNFIFDHLGLFLMLINIFHNNHNISKNNKTKNR